MPAGSRRANGSRPRHRLSYRFVLLLAAVIVAVGTVKLAGPWASTRQQGRELNQLREERAGLQAQHLALVEEQEFLASDEGLEMIARRNGYLRPGERRIVFVPPPAPAD